MNAYSASFDEYFEWLMPWEGERYENDPDDPGGATKYGIDQRSHPDVDIKEMTRDHAKRIYWYDYWLPVAADRMEPRLAMVMADIAVNNGRTRAAQWLQEFLSVPVDGRIGPVTLKAAGRDSSLRLARCLLERREKFYRAIAKDKRKKFLKGWLNRNNDLRKYIRA